MPRSIKFIKQPTNQSQSYLTSRAYFPFYFNLGVLGLLTLAFFCPWVEADSSATGESLATGGATVQAALGVRPTLTVSLTPEVEMDVTPSPGGTFTSATADLKISTNNSTGYSVYVNTNANSTALTSTSLPAEISTLSSPATEESFANNAWGYSFAAENSDHITYRGITKNLQRAKYTTSNAEQDDYTLNFGAKVDNTLPAGLYSNEVTISVITNPTTLTELSELIYMQDMTSDICRNTGEITVGSEITKQLVDIRDGKKYWVAKLADQNCWMTQNLALDLTAEGLSSDMSDINTPNTVWSGAEPGVDTLGQPKAAPTDTMTRLQELTADQTTTTSPNSWNLGQWVLATPSAARNCGSGITDIATCATVGLVDVSGPEWSPTFTATAGTYEGESYSLVAVNPTEHTYDPHYLIGNYYAWNTATAGSGGALTNQTARDSVCPKGWRLPASGYNISGDLNEMLAKYNLKGTDESEVDGQKYNSTAAPFYFTRSGKIANITFLLDNAGKSTYFWTGSPHTDTPDVAYYFWSDTTGNGTSMWGTRREGFSVRCLAR